MTDSPEAFDWGGYLTLAAELAARAGDEAAARSAISRAYYAALGRASTLLRAEGRTAFAANTHATVWRAFSKHPDSRRAEVAETLARLRQLRTAADYAAVLGDDPATLARDAVAWAREILDTLDDLRANPA